MPSIPTARRDLRARTSRFALAVAALVVAAVLPGAASATPPPERGLLVLEGRGGTTTTLELEEEVAFRDPRPTLTRGRTHAAFLVESLDEGPRNRVLIGAVRVTAFRDGTGDKVAFLGLVGRLAAGSYRVTLLGDGHVRASVQLADPDGPGLRVVPRTPVRTQFLARAEPLPAGHATASVDLPRALPKNRRAIQVLLRQGDPEVAETRMCATTGEECRPRVGSPGTTDGSPQILSEVVAPFPFARDLRWRVSGYRLEDDRLRAAAIVF